MTTLPLPMLPHQRRPRQQLSPPPPRQPRRRRTAPVRTSAPPGLLPALVSRAPDWGVSRFVFYGGPGFIHNDHFLSCSERVRGFTAPVLGALGHSTDFSMPVYAADF